MSALDYRNIIYRGTEDRNLEYKRSFLWKQKPEKETMAKVTKTIIAMSNLRDGGHIVIGVAEQADQIRRYRPEGVYPEHLRALNQDNVSDFVRAYAEPFARFSL